MDELEPMVLEAVEGRGFKPTVVAPATRKRSVVSSR